MAAFRHNVVWTQAKRLADSHFFTIKGKQCLLAWRLAIKLGMALDLWTGHTLQCECVCLYVITCMIICIFVCCLVSVCVCACVCAYTCAGVGVWV